MSELAESMETPFGNMNVLPRFQNEYTRVVTADKEREGLIHRETVLLYHKAIKKQNITYFIALHLSMALKLGHFGFSPC